MESTNNSENNQNNANNTGNNQNNENNQTNNANNSNNVNNVEDCVPLQDEFKAAVRALDRDCGSDAECVLALRSGPCDCAIGVNIRSDLATFDTARLSLDDAQCRNPFVCVGDRCDGYNTLSDPGELVPRCVGNECEVTQIMSCTDYEQKKNGGVIGDSPCVEDTDCTVRTDLNPCRCPEAVSTSFPALAGPVIRELITINDERCGTTCDQNCPVGTTAICVDMGDVKRCQLN